MKFPEAWVFPGGSHDPGETLLEAGIREIKEETGISIHDKTGSPFYMLESNSSNGHSTNLIFYFKF